MITTSEIKISVLVDRQQAEEALRAVHTAFELEKPPAETNSGKRTLRGDSDALAVVADLADMEGLRIDDVLLDATQGRITISQIPDEPGVAAMVFEKVAAEGIFVDMIVQSYSTSGAANLSFTAPRENLAAALRVAEELAREMDGAEVTSCSEVAKLSIAGIGMRSHTGVAIRSFTALSGAGINIEMVNTSEVRINLVIDGGCGEEGLAALQVAFADVLTR
jgi:aspartate kinase